MRLSATVLAYAAPCFNPRICKRCDYETKSINEAGHVSIHASVKDATDNRYGQTRD